MADKITTNINGDIVEHASFEVAARYWDSISFNTSILNGGISIKTFDAAGNCTRDGNLIHVSDGHVYVSPTLKV